MAVGGAIRVAAVNEIRPFVGVIAMSEPDTEFLWLKRPKLDRSANTILLV